MKAMIDLDPILEDVLREIMYHTPLVEVAHSLSDLWRVRLNPATVTQSFENEYLLKVPCYPDMAILAPLLQYASIRCMLKMVLLVIRIQCRWYLQKARILWNGISSSYQQYLEK